MLGHLYGPGSPAWRMQLREVDRLIESVVEGLPPGGLLAVVADHGMVAADTNDAVDIDDCASLLDGVQAIGGEPRARTSSTTAQRRPCSRRGVRCWQTVRGWYRETKRSQRGGSVSGCATKSVSASAMSWRLPAARRPWFGAPWSRWSRPWSATTDHSRVPSSAFPYCWPTADPTRRANSSTRIRAAVRFPASARVHGRTGRSSARRRP